MTKKRLKLIYSVLGAIAVIALLYIILTFYTQFNDPLSSFFKRLTPAMLVGSHEISIYDLETAHAIALKLDPQAKKTDVINQLVRVEKMRNVAEEFDIEFTSDRVSDELAYVKNKRGAEYEAFLDKYFNGSEYLFEKFVIYPQAWNAVLTTYYNSQRSLNPAAYAESDNIQTDLENQKKFEDLARLHSDDLVTAPLGGDLGFAQHSQILPELEDAAFILPLGKIHDQAVASRYGIHIVYPIETATIENQKSWHIKHILISTDGFDDWFDQQSAEIKVRTFSKI